MRKKDRVSKPKGRPRASVETEQVTIRLPKMMVDHFRKHEGGMSRAIGDRLERSIINDDIDPKFMKLFGQVEQLAKRIQRYYDAQWYEDLKAHRAFVEAVRRLLADLPEPAATVETPHEPDVVADIIYRDYAASVLQDKRALAGELPRDTVRSTSITTLLGVDTDE